MEKLLERVNKQIAQYQEAEKSGARPPKNKISSDPLKISKLVSDSLVFYDRSTRSRYMLIAEELVIVPDKTPGIAIVVDLTQMPVEARKVMFREMLRKKKVIKGGPLEFVLTVLRSHTKNTDAESAVRAVDLRMGKNVRAEIKDVARLLMARGHS